MPAETAAALWPTVDDVARYSEMVKDKLQRSAPIGGLSTSAYVTWFLEILRAEGRLNTTGTPVVEEWAVLSEDCCVYRVSGAARDVAERELYMLRLGNAEERGEPNARLLRRFVIPAPDGSVLPTERTPWRLVPTPTDPACAPPDRIIDRSTDVPC